MLRGIQAGSSAAVGEMVQSFTTRTFDMQDAERPGYRQQPLALPATQRVFTNVVSHHTSQGLLYQKRHHAGSDTTETAKNRTAAGIKKRRKNDADRPGPGGENQL